MRIFVTVENEDTIKVSEKKYNKLIVIGEFTRPKLLAKQSLQHVTNLFLSSMKFIPTNWSLTNGAVNPNTYGTKYQILNEADLLK